MLLTLVRTEIPGLFPGGTREVDGVCLLDVWLILINEYYNYHAAGASRSSRRAMHDSFDLKGAAEWIEGVKSVKIGRHI